MWNACIKFDNNRSGSFEEYLSNKNSGRRQTDRQTEPGYLIFRTLEVMKSRENVKVESLPMAPLQYFLRLSSESKKQ